MRIEEIISRLESISEHAVHYVGEPPLILSLDDGIALSEAARLMKEHEPVEPKYTPESLCAWRCSVCSEPLSRVAKYCPRCGRAVKWE